MQHPDGRKIVFPYHDEIDRYTLRGALKDAEVDIEEFLRNIKVDLATGLSLRVLCELCGSKENEVL